MEARLSRSVAAAIRASANEQPMRSDLAAAIVRSPSQIAAHHNKIWNPSSFSASLLNRIASNPALSRSYSTAAATGQIQPEKMVTGALNHRIPTHRFLTPPPRASVTVTLIESRRLFPSQLYLPTTPVYRPQKCNFSITSCLNSPSSSPQKTRFNSSTRLYVSGLSFRTTEDSLRNTFQNFGELVEEATPKAIMRTMGVKGLTLFHLKSHLQDFIRWGSLVILGDHICSHGC